MCLYCIFAAILLAKSEKYCKCDGHSLVILIVGLSNLFEIVSELQDVAPRWWNFGLILPLLPQVLDEIQKKVKEPDPERCLCLVLEELLKKNYDSERFGPPSWSLIVKAVGSKAGGNDRALAKKIAMNHPITGTYVYTLVK